MAREVECRAAIEVPLMVVVPPMAEVLYGHVEDQGELFRWAPEETWHAARDRVSFGGVPAPVFAGRGGY
jgi:hypothetical protein